MRFLRLDETVLETDSWFSNDKIENKLTSHLRGMLLCKYYVSSLPLVGNLFNFLNWENKMIWGVSPRELPLILWQYRFIWSEHAQESRTNAQARLWTLLYPSLTEFPKLFLDPSLLRARFGFSSSVTQLIQITNSSTSFDYWISCAVLGQNQNVHIGGDARTESGNPCNYTTSTVGGETAGDTIFCLIWIFILFQFDNQTLLGFDIQWIIAKTIEKRGFYF